MPGGDSIIATGSRQWDLELAVESLPDIAALSALPTDLSEIMCFGVVKKGSFGAAYACVRERDPQFAAIVRDVLHDVARELFFC